MSLTNNDCGCDPNDPVQPGNQLIVPPGTHIIQQPCASTPAQSANISPSAFNTGAASGSNPTGECSGFGTPTVASSFITAGTNQTGSFFASCAGNWGLPGMLMYFPNQGQLEILGASQSSVTYRNRTVAPGVEILEGTRFAVGIPMAPIEVVDTGDDGGSTTPTETIYTDASQLSNIRGVLNNAPSRILPVKNNVLVGRGGGEAGLNWVRRRLGQMRYPVTITPLHGGMEPAVAKSWTLTLPGKPTLPDEVEDFAVELQFKAWIQAIPGSYVELLCNINGVNVLNVGTDLHRDHNEVMHMVTLPKDATSINLTTIRNNGHPGTMALNLDLLAYHY